MIRVLRRSGMSCEVRGGVCGGAVAWNMFHLRRARRLVRIAHVFVAGSGFGRRALPLTGKSYDRFPTCR